MDLSIVGRQFGLNEQQTRAAFDALAPVVAAGLQRNGNAGGGLGNILDSLSKSEPGSTDTLTKHGNDVLGEIFKSKDVSRGVANQVSAETGIGAAVLKKMLPVIASIVMAQLATQMTSGNSSQGGDLGDILGQILGRAAGGQSSGGLGDILGQVLGGAGSGQSGGSLGDILGQVLGGAGGNQATSAGGSLLDSVEKALRQR